MKVWYGGGQSTNGTGEPINDATGQWMPFGCSPRMGATDAGHVLGVLITNRVSGTVSAIRVKVNSNTWDPSDSWSLKLMDYNGGSPTYQDTTIVVTGGDTGDYEDLTSELTVTAGEEYSWKWVHSDGGGSGDMRVANLSYAFEPSGTFAFQLNNAERANVGAATTRHAPPLGDNAGSTEINSSRAKMRIAGSITHFGARMFSNTRGTDSTLQLQVGGSNIGSGITFAGSATGFSEDAGYGTPVAFAVDEYLSLAVVGGSGGGTAEYTCCPITIEPDTEGEFQAGVTSGAGIVLDQGTTRYLPIMGDCSTVASTDGNAEMTAPFDMSLDRFRAYIRANSLAGGQTAVLSIRVNGSAQRTITWAAGVTGEAVASDTDPISVSAGDEVDVEIVCSAGTGSIQFMNLEWRGIEVVTVVAPALHTVRSNIRLN